MKNILIILLLALLALLGAVLLTVLALYEKKASRKIQLVIAQGACVIVCTAALLAATLATAQRTFPPKTPVVHNNNEIPSGSLHEGILQNIKDTKEQIVLLDSLEALIRANDHSN